MSGDVNFGQHTHVGMSRTVNEDFLGAWVPEDASVLSSRGRLLVVCDGMGGHNGGEIASRLAVQTILETYRSTSVTDPQAALSESVERANAAVFAEAQKPGNQEQLKGMGTTVTALVHKGDEIHLAQVGDSRAYLIRGGAIQQLTKDHSLVQQLVDEGLLAAEEMESHPDKNVILRSLGVKPDVEVDLRQTQSQPGDTYLLCSDGLSGLVGPDELLGVVSEGLARGQHLDQVCQKLCERANSYGGHDNITVQLLHLGPLVASATPPPAAPGVVSAQVVEAADVDRGAPTAPLATGENPVPPPTPASPPPSDPFATPAAPATSPSDPFAGQSAFASGADAAPSKGGGGFVQGLVLGLLLGVLGAVGVGVALKPDTAGKATAALAAAEEAVNRADEGPLRERAKALIAEGRKAQAGREFNRALGLFQAARAIYEVDDE
ncbi:MAG: Stp1/IreP family PP2C-type Ser/Thr phosphatase [Planctomycetota bacterium]